MTDLARGLAAATILQAAVVSATFAGGLDYVLEPVEVAPGCFVVIGSEEYFDNKNGGDIANTGFVDPGAFLFATTTSSQS